MRQFLKFMFASMLGTFLIGIVLIFLFIGSLAALGGSFATINDARGFASVAEAAARTRTLHAALKCDNFHINLQ